MKRKKLCKGYIVSLTEAKRHTRKVFRKIDAENQAIDQMEMKL